MRVVLLRSHDCPVISGRHDLNRSASTFCLPLVLPKHPFGDVGTFFDDISGYAYDWGNGVLIIRERGSHDTLRNWCLGGMTGTMV